MLNDYHLSTHLNIILYIHSEITTFNINIKAKSYKGGVFCLFLPPPQKKKVVIGYLIFHFLYIEYKLHISSGNNMLSISIKTKDVYATSAPVSCSQCCYDIKVFHVIYLSCVFHLILVFCSLISSLWSLFCPCLISHLEHQPFAGLNTPFVCSLHTKHLFDFL